MEFANQLPAPETYRLFIDKESEIQKTASAQMVHILDKLSIMQEVHLLLNIIELGHII
jgi:alpha-D-ribose 1-methylphosphonate 5-phosphate C-P lyase